MIIGEGDGHCKHESGSRGTFLVLYQSQFERPTAVSCWISVTTVL